MTNESDLPARTLADVRQHSRRRSSRRRDTGSVDTPQFSGSSHSDRDLVLADQTVSELVAERGWVHRSAVGSVVGRWRHLVGESIASHASPEDFDEQSATLSVVADSATWATQLRLLSPEILRRIDDEVGAGVVKSIVVSARSRRAHN